MRKNVPPPPPQPAGSGGGGSKKAQPSSGPYESLVTVTFAEAGPIGES